MTSVRVARPFRNFETISSYSHAVADVFEKDVLTISTIGGDEWEVFQPGDWNSADVIDDDGDLVCRFLPSERQERKSA